MTRLEMYEHNLSKANRQLTELAADLVDLTAKGFPPHEEDSLLSDMVDTIERVRKYRFAVSVAKSTLLEQSNMDKALSACRTMKSLTPPQD